MVRFENLHTFLVGVPRWFSRQRIRLRCRRHRRCRLDLWVGKIPWRRKWQPTPVFLTEKSHGQRNPAGYSPWGRKKSDTTERLSSTVPSLNPGTTLLSQSTQQVKSRIRTESCLYISKMLCLLLLPHLSVIHHAATTRLYPGISYRIMMFMFCLCH